MTTNPTRAYPRPTCSRPDAVASLCCRSCPLRRSTASSKNQSSSLTAVPCPRELTRVTSSRNSSSLRWARLLGKICPPACTQAPLPSLCLASGGFGWQSQPCCTHFRRKSLWRQSAAARVASSLHTLHVLSALLIHMASVLLCDRIPRLTDTTRRSCAILLHTATQASLATNRTLSRSGGGSS